MDTLLEMKEQLQVLKAKLDEQEIVNDQLLRHVTQQRMRRINRNVWQQGFCCLFVVTFGNYVFRASLHCSWYFVAGTCLLMLVSFLATLLPHRWVSEEDINTGDLLTVAKQVRRLRKWYKDWYYVGIPLVVLWLMWLGVELYFAFDRDLTMLISTMVGALIGGAIGGFVGHRMNKRLIHEMDDLIDEIEKE